jgi:dolichyl-phosphate beta-glucosyltransferase
MRQRLRRFAAVGLVVTAVDVALLLAGRVGLGLPVVVADGVSVLVAAAVSYLLHRAVTFADDPYRRWVHQTRTFAWVTAVAGALDVAVIRLAVVAFGSTSALSVLAAKAVSLAVADLVRGRAYRRRLLADVREEQGRRRSPSSPPPLGDRRLSVVVPAFREEAAIAGTVARLRSALAGVDAEVVVVDDGSGDGTAGAATAAGADQVVALASNRGKGAAVRAGVLAARGRTIAFTDADLSYPPEQLLALLAHVEEGWDMVVGSRKHVETTTLVRAGRVRDLSSRLFNVLTEVVLLGRYRDTQCGLKAFRSDVARSLFARTRVDRFAFDVELFHLAERDRLSLLEVPVAVASAPSSSVRLGLDAARMVRDLFRIRRWSGEGRYDQRTTANGPIDLPRSV